MRPATPSASGRASVAAFVASRSTEEREIFLGPLPEFSKEPVLYWTNTGTSLGLWDKGRVKDPGAACLFHCGHSSPWRHCSPFKDPRLGRAWLWPVTHNWVVICVAFTSSTNKQGEMLKPTAPLLLGVVPLQPQFTGPQKPGTGLALQGSFKSETDKNQTLVMGRGGWVWGHWTLESPRHTME